MKHLFIVNPIAGSGGRADFVSRLIPQILDADYEYEVYVTNAPMDACRKVCEDAESGGEIGRASCRERV